MPNLFQRIARTVRGAPPATRPGRTEALTPSFVSEFRQRRIGIVGVGSQGTKLARLVQSLGYDLAVACDLDPVRLAEIKKAIPSARTTADLRHVASEDPEICIVATLAPSHATVIEALAEGGITRILCEKPICNSVHDLRRIRSLVADRGLQLRVFHTRFYSPDYIDIKRELQKRAPGALQGVDLVFRPGGFGNLGTHFAALVCDLSGREIVGVESAQFNQARTIKRSADLEDPDGRATFTLEGGGVAQLSNFKRDWRGKDAVIRLSFQDLEVEIVEGERTTFTPESGPTTILRFQHPHPSLPTRYRCIDTALGELLTNSSEDRLTPSCMAAEAIIAAQVSHVRGGPVTLPLDQNEPTPFPFS